MENLTKVNEREKFIQGMKDSIPIALGYFAVAFSLGLTAKYAGLTPFQGFLISILNNASAGEYITFQAIMDSVPWFEIVILTLVANSRYFLMSSAFSQKIDPKTPFFHRFFMTFDLTDEIFGLAMAQKGYISPYYIYGMFFLALPSWSIATALGVIAGNIFSEDIVRALSMSLYGMFLAIIFPQAKKDRGVLISVIASFLISYAWDFMPFAKSISGGTKILIFTVIISTVIAILFPIKDDENEK